MTLATGKPRTGRTPEIQRRVIAAFKRWDELTPGQVSELAGCSRDHAYQLLKTLTDRGLIRRIQPGLYRPARRKSA